MMKEIELVFIPDSKYVHNMQSAKGKGNIFYKDEPSNKYDAEAIAIYTINQAKEEIFLGYIKKNNVQTIFTERANDLYEMAQCHEMSWEEAKADEKWAEVKEIIKEPIYTSNQLGQIKKDILNGIYKFRYEYDVGYGYLFRSTP